MTQHAGALQAQPQPPQESLAGVSQVQCDQPVTTMLHTMQITVTYHLVASWRSVARQFHYHSASYQQALHQMANAFEEVETHVLPGPCMTTWLLVAAPTSG